MDKVRRGGKGNREVFSTPTQPTRSNTENFNLSHSGAASPRTFLIACRRGERRDVKNGVLGGRGPDADSPLLS